MTRKKIKKKTKKMDNILDKLNFLNEYIKTKKKIFIFLDFDGTLSTLKPKPHLAFLSDEMKNLLQDLKNKYFLGIISGRELSNLKEKVNIKNICYAGNHGFEIECKNIKNSFIHEKAKECSDYLNLLTKQIEQKIKKLESDILIEDKFFSLSIHYRGLPNAKELDLKKIFDDIFENFEYKKYLAVFHGKKVIEVKPNINWHKGKAIDYILKNSDLSKSDIGVIFIGDDTTDEDGFLELKNYNGISIKVGENIKHTNALFSLKNVDEVFMFLKEINSWEI
jgi:trehalose-phosphatase